MQYHIQRGRFVNGPAYMDFKKATDRLFDKIDHEDLAREMGVSVAAVRQARLREGALANRAPPSEWRAAVKALTERRLSHYTALLEDLNAEDREQKSATVAALRSRFRG
jgi:hypothetical protein